MAKKFSRPDCVVHYPRRKDDDTQWFQDRLNAGGFLSDINVSVSQPLIFTRISTRIEGSDIWSNQTPDTMFMYRYSDGELVGDVDANTHMLGSGNVWHLTNFTVSFPRGTRTRVVTERTRITPPTWER